MQHGIIGYQVQWGDRMSKTARTQKLLEELRQDLLRELVSIPPEGEYCQEDADLFDPEGPPEVQAAYRLLKDGGYCIEWCYGTSDDPTTAQICVVHEVSGKVVAGMPDEAVAQVRSVFQVIDVEFGGTVWDNPELWYITVKFGIPGIWTDFASIIYDPVQRQIVSGELG